MSTNYPPNIRLSKIKIRDIRKIVKYAQVNYQYVNDAVLVSLLLTLNISHIF